MPRAATVFRTKASTPRPRVDNRPSAAARGYDEKFRRLAIAYRKQHPHCEDCLDNNITIPGHEVDHIIPFKGMDDPLRLKWKNLRHRCRPCHARKTAADKREAQHTAASNQLNG